MLYTTGGMRRSVVALDGRSRRDQLGRTACAKDKRAAVSPRQLSGRGVSYWTDGKGDERVIYFTTGYRMVELDARTGALIPTFANGGVLDLKVGVVKGVNQQIDLETGEIGIHSTPTVVGDIVDRRIIVQRGRDGFHPQQHQGARSRVRRSDRQAIVAVQHHSGAGRVRQ